MDKLMDNFGVFDYVETQDGTYEYTAEEIRSYFSGIIGDGILKGKGGEFEASADGLQVTLQPGEAWLLGIHGTMLDAWSVDLDPVVSGMSRICSFVLDADITNQLMGVTILVGSQAASPSAPELTQTQTRYQQLICRAQVHDDNTVTFADARTIVSKPGDGVTPESIGAAKRSYAADYTLLAAGWSSSQYEITTAKLSIMEHVTGSETPVHLGIALTATDAQAEALQNANIRAIAQSAGSITLKAKGTVPSVNCPIAVVVEGGVY